LGVLAAAAVILGFGAWAVWWSARKGTLHVRTNAAAIVSIDGEDVGTSPLDLALSTGMHRVRIRLENHREYSQDVRIEGDTTTSVERMLMPLTPIEAATVAIHASGPALEKIRTTGDAYRLVARLCAAGEQSTAEAYVTHVFDPTPAGLRAELSRWKAWSGDRAVARAADVELAEIEQISSVSPMPPSLGREILDRLGRLVLPADAPPSPPFAGTTSRRTCRSRSACPRNPCGTTRRRPTWLATVAGSCGSISRFSRSGICLKRSRPP